MFRLFNVQQILAASPLAKQVQGTFAYGINISAMLIGFVVLLLSFVFEYGAKLQEESDELL